MDDERTLQRHREELGRLSAAIRRIIEVMKQEDLLSSDLREEYWRMVADKERLQGECERLQVALEHRRQRVLDPETIRRCLADFERLVAVLPLDDQKALFGLLLREAVVAPFEPAREPFPEEPGALVVQGRGRGKWYRLRLTLHRLPGVALRRRLEEAQRTGVNHTRGRKFGFGEDWLPDEDSNLEPTG